MRSMRAAVLEENGQLAVADVDIDKAVDNLRQRRGIRTSLSIPG